MDLIAQEEWGLKSPPNCEEIRNGIFAIQDYMKTLPSRLEDCVVVHRFAPGCYAREMTIPKGVLIIGKIHRHAHLNIISKGKVSVITEFGPMHFEAPHTFVSDVGTKRVVFAEEETVWTTIHPTEETDLEKIEEYVIAKNYAEIGMAELDLIEVSK